MERKDLGRYAHRNKWILLFAIIYSAFVFMFSPQAALLYDSALYADIAKNLIKDMCFCSNFQARPFTPPVYPMLIAGSMLLFGSLFIKALLAGISLFGILVSYHFIMKISNSRRISLMSSSLFFLTPLLIYNSMLLLIDLIFAIMVILSLWAYASFLEKKGSKALVILAGITAIAIMTKMAGYVLIPMYAVHFILDRKKHKMDFGRLLALFLLTTLFLLPWTLWRSSIGLNEMKVGELLISGGGYGHISLTIESFYSSGEPMNAIPLILDMKVPVQAVNMARILASLMIYVTPIITMYFAYCLAKPKKSFRGKYDSMLLVWIISFLGFFVFGFFYFGSRYLTPIVLPVVFFFARFLDSKMARKRLMVLLLITVQMLSVAAITCLDSMFIWSKSQTEVFSQTGKWIRENTEPGAIILPLGAPEGALVYYGERKVTGINETAPDYVVKSNFSSSMDVASYERQAGTGYHLIKALSDGKYYSEIYKRS